MSAARISGANRVRIVVVHLLPNVLDSILVLSTLQVAQMILAESFLSFIGFGVQSPLSSWGSMLSEGRVYFLNKWWLATFPGMAIFVTALGVNLTGDLVRDLLDPQFRHRA
jgi:peptide/nickel transport system permease protein